MNDTRAHPEPLTYPVLGATGGGVAVLSQLIKMAVLEDITGRRITSLFPGGIIFDSGGGFLVAGLQKFPARDLIGTFIDTAPKGMPTSRFFLMQTFHATMSGKSHEAVRLSPDALTESLDILVGQDTIEHVPFGFSAGLYNVGADYNQHATYILKVPHFNKKTFCYYESSQTSFSDIVLAGSAIPTLFSFATINHVEGKFVDPTMDQNPAVYIGELRRLNRDIATTFVRLGNFSPSPEAMTDLLANSSAISYKSWIRSMQRTIFKRSEEAYLLSRDYATPTVDLETLLDHRLDSLTPDGDLKNPTYNPIQSDPVQLRRICLMTLRDIKARKDLYCQIGRSLVANLAQIEGETCHWRSPHDTMAADLDQSIEALTAEVDRLLPPKPKKQRPIIDGISAKIDLTATYARTALSAQNIIATAKWLGGRLSDAFHRQIHPANDNGSAVTAPPPSHEIKMP